jgi:hypothetical protein
MTDPYTNVANSASDQATVGFQAETIHGDVYSYVIRPDAPAEERYEIGVNYLDGGVPSAALPLIEQAIAEGHDSSEVRFYWLLALISGRTSRQFAPEDNTRLDRIKEHPVVYQHDPWAEGIRVILRLLDSLHQPGNDPGPFISALDQLHPAQRGPIVRHLAVFLKGPLGDQVWKLEHKAALDGRHAGGRDERVGLFFQPAPARLRARQPAPAVISAKEWMTATGAAAAFVLVLIGIGWQLLRHGSIVGLIGYVTACVGFCLAAPNRVDARWRARRRAGHEWLAAPAARAEAPPGGFAARVDHRFDHYFAVRAPHGTDRAEWLAATSGARRHLRDEIVEIYREQRTSAEQLDWLIRHEVETLARRWKAGTSITPDEESHAKPSRGTARSAAIAASVPGGLLFAWALLHLDRVGGFTALAVLTVCGYLVERRWTAIALERRRAAADVTQAERKLAEREAAYKAWIEKLSDIKPTDQDIAAWIDCDKKIILEYALRHYGLKRSDVISYAFLETPGTSYKRARVRNGPWRYTQYKIHVFLLTGDGLRQIAFDLRTRDSYIQDLERESYGYDAITSVQASAPRNDSQQTFHLHLVSGRTISFRVVDPATPPSPENGDDQIVNNVTQDATGLRNTLRILEGVAADGKGWIARETQTSDGHDVQSVVGGL